MMASAWTIVTGLGTRLLGVVGTLVLTYFIAPDAYGQVSAAVIIVFTANQFSSLSLGTYVLAHPKAGRDVMFHASVLHIGMGFVAFGFVLAGGHRLGPWIEAPGLGRYLPFIVLALALDRVSYMPERVLIRAMRFAPLSKARGLSELAYTAGSVATAVAGWEGMAIVAGNLARSALRLALIARLVNWRDWLEPVRLRLQTMNDMVRYGVPVSVGGFAEVAMRKWDSLIISRFFGPAVMGTYTMARSLAEIPAVQVGEQISDVLQAAFSRIDGGDRRRALLRSLAMLAFIMAPMAIGLAAIAPTLATAFLDHRWAGVGIMLIMLAVISFTRPISTTIGAYLQIRHHHRVTAVMDIITAALVIAALLTVGRTSPVWACTAVALAFGISLLIWAGVMKALENVPVPAFFALLVRPLIACVPMVAAITAVHHLLPAVGHGPSFLALVVEIVVGALAYAGAAWVIARKQARELLMMVRRARRRTS
jgi:PST family polysaccharide transporter